MLTLTINSQDINVTAHKHNHNPTVDIHIDSDVIEDSEEQAVTIVSGIFDAVAKSNNDRLIVEMFNGILEALNNRTGWGILDNDDAEYRLSSIKLSEVGNKQDGTYDRLIAVYEGDL